MALFRVTSAAVAAAALTFLALVIVSPTPTAGCGATTHTLIAHRAIEYFFSSRVNNTRGATFPDILSRHTGAWQAGAPFPDWGYQCTNHSYGEDSHWPPFQAAAANYTRSLPTPWSDDAETLVAFFFGIVSHYIADLTWHGLSVTPHGYGFIETLGTQDFNCTGDLCSVAHGAADTGGEFVAAYAADLGFAQPWAWEVPTQHLHNIFLSIGDNFTVAQLELCHIEFFVEVMAVRYLSPLLFTVETAKARHLVENYHAHRQGGVDDMAVWTGRMYNRYEAWLEEGPPSTIPPLFGVGTKAKAGRITSENHRALRREAASVLKEVLPDLQSHTTDADGILRVRATQHGSDEDTAAHRHMFQAVCEDSVRGRRLRELLGHALGTRISEQDALVAMELWAATEGAGTAASTSPVDVESVPGAVAGATASYAGVDAVGYAGDALARGDYDGDGKDDLAFSAWGAQGTTRGRGQVGTVYVALSSDDADSTSGSLPATSMVGSDINGRLGTKLATVDFNCDGVDDLAASAPAAGWNWTKVWDPAGPRLTYMGKVYVWFGGKSFPAAQPDVEIVSATHLQGLGLGFLGGLDVNGDKCADLVIGSSQSRGAANATNDDIQQGDVRVFTSSSKRTSGTVLADTSADLILWGPAQFGWFGASAVVARTGGAPTDALLVVGAPGARPDSSAAARGRVYAYAVGSDAALSALATEATPRFTITGSVNYGQFGHALAAGSPVSAAATPMSYVAVSAPSTDLPLGVNRTSSGVGRVLVLQVSANLTGEYDADSVPGARTTLECSSAGARCGWDLEFASVTGDAPGVDDLVMSAPLNGSFWGLHEAGAVLVYQGGQDTFPSGVVGNCEASATASVQGPAKFGRFGGAVVAGDFGIAAGGARDAGAAVSGLAIGAPRVASPAGNEYAGVVTVL